MSTVSEPATPPRLDLPDGSVRTLVCDSHAASRIGVGVVLRRQSWASRVLLASDREEAIEYTQRFKPDVAIVDISNVGPFVASHIAPLRAARPEMAILLSSHCRVSPGPSLSAAGATGMLSPGFTVDELVSAICEALVGEETLPHSQARDVSDLSDRQREVLALISTGATNREIAAVMQVGTETVKKHAEAVYRKLGVRNRTEAAQRAAELLRA